MDRWKENLLSVYEDILSEVFFAHIYMYMPIWVKRITVHEEFHLVMLFCLQRHSFRLILTWGMLSASASTWVPTGRITFAATVGLAVLLQEPLCFTNEVKVLVTWCMMMLLPMWFPRQEYWSGVPFPSPGTLPRPGIEPVSPVLAGGFFTTESPGKLKFVCSSALSIGVQ